MTHLEEKALETSPITPLCWFRKVDDTFVILHPNNDPRTLLGHLDYRKTQMQFTLEEETNQQISFLDVLVQKDNNDKLQTTVYRKPTHLHVPTQINTFTMPPTIHLKSRKELSQPLRDELTTSVLRNNI
ncbi:uncharacterized protein LOC124142168 [Haliotis rufescens]|uniref:uncharacterized protein LOC124142168 n=1 Tax=Haliotis rufescens TaxID=6454 RepID=UPI00201EAE91|nr:uncharacterized protein LOC124142168 [Haliotis rufescens]